jgi:hypothetical protein
LYGLCDGLFVAAWGCDWAGEFEDIAGEVEEAGGEYCGGMSAVWEAALCGCLSDGRHIKGGEDGVDGRGC